MKSAFTLLLLLTAFSARADVGTDSNQSVKPESQTEKERSGTTEIQKATQEEARLLERHRPFYFAYGRPLSKLQLSFKTPIIRSWPVYFAYTQIMFWELEASSKPFRDLTYNPELFYRYSPKDWGWLKSLDFGAWGHTSNGKKDQDSRSLDSQYLRMNFDREGRRWLTRLSLQFSYLHGFDPTNEDIRDYISPISFTLSFVQLFDAWIDKSEFALQLNPGGHFGEVWDQGGYQLSWSFRAGKLDLQPAFYLQYYHGYAETLLNYNQSVDVFRGGFVF